VDLTAKLLERIVLPSDPQEAGKAVAIAFTEILKAVPLNDASAPDYEHPTKAKV
jgi:hypothetical protein